jgi:hypothetical protein
MMMPRKKRADRKKIEKPVSVAGSVALKRIIEEVRNNDPKQSGGYNRTYHRHNR